MMKKIEATGRGLPAMNSSREAMRISVFDLYVKLIFLMPLTALLQQYIDVINRALFVVIFILQIFLLFRAGYNRRHIIYFLAALIIYLIGLIRTENLTFDNSIVYYINWLIYSCLIVLYKDRYIQWFEESRRFVYFIANVWTFLVGISIVLPSSWYYKEGGTLYFGSFTDSIFRLGPTAVFIATLAVVMIAFYHERRAIAYTFIPLFCGLMGSSRTYFIVITLIFIIALYCWSKNSKQFFQVLIPAAVIVVIIYGFSSIGEKVSYTLDVSNYGDFWFRITSSRTEIWEKLIAAFGAFSWSEKLFGAGYGYSTRLVGVYAHNDFLEILITHGLSGEILYLISMYWLFKAFFKKHRTAIVLVCLAIAVWLFNAFFNMFYYYICAALSFPLLLMAVERFCVNETDDAD